MFLQYVSVLALSGVELPVSRCNENKFLGGFQEVASMLNCLSPPGNIAKILPAKVASGTRIENTDKAMPDVTTFGQVFTNPLHASKSLTNINKEKYFISTENAQPSVKRIKQMNTNSKYSTLCTVYSSLPRFGKNVLIKNVSNETREKDDTCQTTNGPELEYSTVQSYSMVNRNTPPCFSSPGVKTYTTSSVSNSSELNSNIKLSSELSIIEIQNNPVECSYCKCLPPPSPMLRKDIFGEIIKSTNKCNKCKEENLFT